MRGGGGRVGVGVWRRQLVEWKDVWVGLGGACLEIALLYYIMLCSVLFAV